MRRITLFAKGNLDVRDALHALRIGGEVRWNGINELVRARHPGVLVSVRHETCTRSDALLAADGRLPAELAARPLPLDAYGAATQFSTAVFDTAADVWVLSLQPDVMTHLVRHRRDGYLFCAYGSNEWPAKDRAWLREHFAGVPALDAAASMRHLERIVSRLRERSAAPILVFNLSSAIPGDSVHCHEGLGDILATRLRRFNLALIELSQRTGISIVDVDAVVARLGVAHAKLDTLHFTVAGAQAVAAEVLRIMEDTGCFEAAELAR